MREYPEEPRPQEGEEDRHIAAHFGGTSSLPGGNAGGTNDPDELGEAARAVVDSFSSRPLRALNYWDSEFQRRMARLFPGRPNQQLNAMLKERPEILAGTGRWRKISDERLTKLFTDFSGRFFRLFRKPSKETETFFRERQDIPLPALSDIVNVGPEHVTAFLYWLSCRYKTGQFGIEFTEVEITCCRRLLTLLGKRDLLPSGVELREYLKAKEILLPVPTSIFPAHAGGWEARGVPYRTVLRRIPRRSRHIRRVLWLKIIFGLRLRECVRQQLAEWLTRLGLRLPAKRGGGKGGLPRFVPLPTWHRDWRHWRRVLDKLVAFASAQPSGLLMPEGISLKNARAQVTTALAMAGAHKRGMGISSHGTRYDAAVAAFFWLTGLPAPALRKLPHTAYTDSKGTLLPHVRKALLRISGSLGHKRMGIAERYVGSVAQLRRESRKALLLAGRLKPLAGMLEAAACEGHVGAFLLDRLGNYDYHLALRFDDAVEVGRIRKVMADLREAASAMGYGYITIRVHEGDGVPASFQLLAPARH